MIQTQTTHSSDLPFLLYVFTYYLKTVVVLLQSNLLVITVIGVVAAVVVFRSVVASGVESKWNITQLFIVLNLE